jgi:hypothetical protein
MKTMKSFYVVVLLPVFCLIACTTPSSVPSLPGPTPSVEPIPASGPGYSTEAMSWRITPTSQSQTYSSLLTTTIEQQEVSTTRRDSLKTLARYSISTARVPDTLLITGSVTEFSVTSNVPEADKIDISSPVSFTGKLTSHDLLIQTSGNNQLQDFTNCENPASTSLKVLQRNVFVLPLELRTAQTWTDSISSVTCAGTLPVISTVIRAFTVAGLTEIEGSRAILINQNERTFSEGEGSQGQHRISIQGEGSTSGRVYIDPDSGVLLASSFTNKTTLSIQSSGRVQHFVQNSTETTQRSH